MLITVNPIVLKDRAQDKDTALRVTVPATGGRLPIVLFSHGAQYSKDDYLPLTEYWAAAGYAVIQPTHIESRTIGLPREDARVQGAWKSRALDFKLILDSLDEIERAAPVLKGRFDRKRVVAAGHSFGGQTVSLLIGGRSPDPATNEETDLSDPRVAAAVLLAPPGQMPKGFLNMNWQPMSKPALVIVGEQDIIKGFNDSWEAHADPYYKGPGGEKCLANLTGMKHYLGGTLGTNRTEEQTPSPEALQLIQRMTLAFFNTWARGAKDWPTMREEMLKTRPAALSLFECK
jgi:predicted dienelactone hydrolase